jgi:hypothetical protein
MYQVPEGTSTFTIGREPFLNLASEIEFNGRKRADAQEDAFDYLLLKAGGRVTRVGEVFVPAIGDLRTSYVEALCVGADYATA